MDLVIKIGSPMDSGVVEIDHRLPLKIDRHECLSLGILANTFL